MSQGFIEYLIALAGVQCCVAGGAIRDLHLDLQPKDYDIFFWDEASFKKAISSFNFRECNQSYPDKENWMIAEGVVEGESVQLIYHPDREAGHEAVIEQFDYTINMASWTSEGLHTPPEFLEAIKNRELVINPLRANFVPYGRHEVMSLLKRGKYLSKKLTIEFERKMARRVQELFDSKNKQPRLLKVVLEKCCDFYLDPCITETRSTLFSNATVTRWKWTRLATPGISVNGMTKKEWEWRWIEKQSSVHDDRLRSVCSPLEFLLYTKKDLHSGLPEGISIAR